MKNIKISLQLGRTVGVTRWEIQVLCDDKEEYRVTCEPVAKALGSQAEGGFLDGHTSLTRDEIEQLRDAIDFLLRQAERR